MIFLIGYRGSGKSTVGRVLAERLGWPFADADAVLEERFGQSIRDIFASEGESGFREKETAVLSDLCQQTKTVIATGGGIVLRTENRERIRNKGFVAWLTASPTVLWARMQDDPTTAARRPPLSMGGLLEVEQLLAIREPYYRECANVEVDVERLSPEQAADAILAAWTLPPPSGPHSHSSSASLSGAS